MDGQRVDSGASVANGLSAQVRIGSDRVLMVTPAVGGSAATTSNPVPVRQYDGSGNPISYGFTPTEITTKTTTTVKTGPGMIGSIIVNTVGSADTITVYDALSATGTPIATIASPLVGQAFCVGYNFGVGCTIVTGGTTAGKYTAAIA